MTLPRFTWCLGHSVVGLVVETFSKLRLGIGNDFPQVPSSVSCEKGVQIMASLNWSQCTAVESIPGKVSGAWVFKNTRMPVSIMFENLEAGATIDEIMDWFHLTREQIVTVLEFAARSLDPSVFSQQATTPSTDAHPV